MSGSDRALVSFDVVAADQATEIFLVDGNFSLAGRGIGRKTFSVPRGIYKIKARSGRATVEKMIVVRAGLPPVHLDPVPFPTAIPLEKTGKLHERHRDAVVAAARQPSLVKGTGSAILIVVRQWTAAERPKEATEAISPARGLFLRSLDGTLRVDLAAVATQPTDAWDPCVTVHLAADPGAYRLSSEVAGGRRVELTVVACRGWRTEVFVLLDRNGRPDLSSAGITMQRLQAAFDASAAEARLTEVARVALADDRDVLSAEIRQRVSSSQAAPMLALLGAHLLIREAKDAKAESETAGDMDTPSIDSRPAVQTIVANLRAAIGKHPDVEAIAIGAGLGDPTYVFDAPPMLRASWRLLLKASVQQPEIIPAGSYLAQVAERLWGEGPWLLSLDHPAADRAASWQGAAQVMLANIARQEARRPAERPGEPGAHPPGVAGGGTGGGLAGVAIGAAGSPLGAAVGGAIGEAAAEAAPAAATAATVPAPAAPGVVGTVMRGMKSFFTRRARRAFPDVREAARRDAVDVPSMDAAQVRRLLGDDVRRLLVKRLGVPMSSIDEWVDTLKQP
jgi:hypothetical protein